jgi:hypothetical protein
VDCFSQQNQAKDFKKLQQLYKDIQFDSIAKYNPAQVTKANPEKEGKISEIFAEVFLSLNQDDKAYEQYIKARTFYQDNGDLENVASINARLYFLVDGLKNVDIDKSIYLKALKEYATETRSSAWFMVYYNLKGIENFNPTQKDSAKYYFVKAHKIATEIDSIKLAVNTLNNLGVLHLNEYQQPDSAIYYYKKALQLSQNEMYNGDKNQHFFDMYNNLGRAHIDKADYSVALSYYKKADEIELKKYKDQSKRLLYGNMEVNYYYLNDFENAYTYLYKYDSINEIIKYEQQKANIAEIEEKFQNEKLRADNLEIQTISLQNRNIAIGLGGSLVLVSIIGLLAYQNKQRQQKLILQEREVKAQQLQSQLKEEELKSINAMVEGQEKERLRIANDLHDDLGSLMANIKMHFGTFKNKDTDNLFQRTNSLIEEAYQKIRNIAHAKNSGVLARQGLYEAIKKHGKSISASKEIKVKVIENGLNQRLENSIELTIFRVIQELITNVIKHAQATELDIHLNQHDNILNIMVEDNGVGFNTTKVLKENSGMGLTSIERRIEKLGGTVIVESQPKNGTSVIIDIPI